MQFLSQPEIGALIGVNPNTVHSTWRNATLREIRAHLAAAGLDEAHLSVPVDRLTRDVWEAERRRLGLRPLHLSAAALALPDSITGNKPGWRLATIEQWATDTRRRDPQTGEYGKKSPPGRPVGVIETRPRPARAA